MRASTLSAITLILSALAAAGCSSGSSSDSAASGGAQTGSFAAKASLPAARQEHGVVALDGLVYAIGGFDVLGQVLSSVEAYDPVADTWEVLAPMTTPRHGLGGAALNGLVHLPGGGNAQGFAQVATHEGFTPP